MRAIPSKPVEELIPDPKREGAVRVMVGGRTVLIVPEDAARQEGLAVGRRLDAGQVERLEAASDRAAAYRTALQCLERRPFGKRDLARRLTLKGHDPDAVIDAVNRAEAAGLLDDEKFARFYVRSRGARGRGPSRLRRELAQMGIARDLIDAALAAESDPAAVETQIDALIAKRAAQLKDLPPAQAKRRLVAFLARRGFGGAELTNALRRARDGR